MNQFDLRGKSIVITGGAGVLGTALARGFSEAGASIAILDRDQQRAEEVAKTLGDHHIGIAADVLEPEMLQSALDACLNAFGKVDVLVNGAGGNHPKSTTSPDMPFFDIPKSSLEFVANLNLNGTILPSQVFGKYFADQGMGNIMNISSMSATRPMTRVVAYSAAKAAVTNFTHWLAVHLAQEYSQNIRVNALAPGFFLTKQNRFLLTNETTGELTERGARIIDHTPQGRFGEPDDLLGTAIWLASDASRFVTGIVVPVDGGFSAYSGV